jgi:hypothetical protein
MCIQFTNNKFQKTIPLADRPSKSLIFAVILGIRSHIPSPTITVVQAEKHTCIDNKHDRGIDEHQYDSQPSNHR